MPVDGYTAFFRRMLASKLIDVRLRLNFLEVRDLIPVSTPAVYTGAIDAFFDYCAGHLGWRTLDFEQEVVSV
jgi:UDP-galactopyranose mutase